MRKNKKDNLPENIEEVIEEDHEEDCEYEGVNPDFLLPTGITLLNLACSDTIVGGLNMGKINTIPGSSSSGKSFLAFNIMAAIANNDKFNNYDIIYDDAENALEFNISALFGNKLKSRLLSPRKRKDGKPVYSNTIQEFKSNVLARLNNSDKPFFWCLDSLDSLSTDEELEKEYKEAIRDAKSAEHVKELKGSYNTEKSKIIGQTLRIIKGELKKTNSSLNIIQQLRQKINAGPFEKKNITSGGEAPYYYSTHQLWTTKITTHKEETTKIIYGQRTKIDVTKNKLTGKKRSIEIDIYDSYGIDNTSANINYLVDNKIWACNRKIVTCPEFEIEKHITELPSFIEGNNLHKELDQIVEKTWLEIEESIKLERVKRFE